MITYNLNEINSLKNKLSHQLYRIIDEKILQLQYETQTILIKHILCTE